MKIKIFLILSLVAAFSVSSFAQKAVSVYTSLDTKNCKTLESDESGAGSYKGECKGTGGYKLHVLEGDIRQTINVIAPGNKEFELNFWNFYSSFSAVGEKAEWRVKGKNPIALIVRFNVSNPEYPDKSTSYLMVSKITKNEVCVTDVVKPSKTQNAEAQKLADMASTKPCKAVE